MGKALSSFRALTRMTVIMTVIERFSETAMLAADVPHHSAPQVRSLAAVHFRLPMRTMRVNPMNQLSFRLGHPTDAARLLGYECVSLPASEKAAKQTTSCP
jgi:hypothetical protein